MLENSFSVSKPQNKHVWSIKLFWKMVLVFSNRLKSKNKLPSYSWQEFMNAHENFFLCHKAFVYLQLHIPHWPPTTPINPFISSMPHAFWRDLIFQKIWLSTKHLLFHHSFKSRQIKYWSQWLLREVVSQ